MSFRSKVTVHTYNGHITQILSKVTIKTNIKVLILVVRGGRQNSVKHMALSVHFKPALYVS